MAVEMMQIQDKGDSGRPKAMRGTDGAAHVSSIGVQVSTGAQTYSGGTTATAVALSTGATSLDVDNYHATQHVWINFGASSAAATSAVGTNGAETGTMIRANSSKPVAVPDGATHFAYICSGAATTFNINQAP